METTLRLRPSLQAGSRRLSSMLVDARSYFRCAEPTFAHVGTNLDQAIEKPQFRW